MYVCTLDGSKAFDRVNLLTLFKQLHKCSMCPLFLRFLMHSYCNKKMRIKRNSALPGTFNTSNGVKQGCVFSPLLFNIYLDQHILSLQDLGVGCQLNGMFVGAFSYADDVTLTIYIVGSNNRVGKMPAFMSKVHVVGIYRRLLTLLGFFTVSLY